MKAPARELFDMPRTGDRVLTLQGSGEMIGMATPVDSPKRSWFWQAAEVDGPYVVRLDSGATAGFSLDRMRREV